MNSGGGTFVKWTGDGFLAFYEIPLDRELASTAEVIFDAIFFLTLIVNVTRLCIEGEERIRIRHAVTYEKDALLSELEHSEHMKSKDVLGRNVVAAFRLSSIPCDFPGIVTHREVLRAFDDAGFKLRLRFKSLPIKKEMLLRYFKGETYGSKDVYVSDSKQPRKRSKTLKPTQKRAADLLQRIESGEIEGKDSDLRLFKFRRKFFDELKGGPSWFGDIVEKLARDFLIPGLSALKEFNRLPPSTRRHNLAVSDLRQKVAKIMLPTKLH